MTATIRLKNGEAACVDSNMVEQLNLWRWTIIRKLKDRSYVGRYEPVRDGDGTVGYKVVYMHNEVACPPTGYLVEYINNDRLDLRRGNLHVILRSEQAHRRQPRAKSTSVYRGVSQEKKTGRWLAQIRINGMNKRIGLFDTEGEASQAYEGEAQRGAARPS